MTHFSEHISTMKQPTAAEGDNVDEDVDGDDNGEDDEEERDENATSWDCLRVLFGWLES